jgi:hypothetical protein
MVDEDDGDGMPPLQVPQIGEQWRHLAADVLVDLVDPPQQAPFVSNLTSFQFLEVVSEPSPDILSSFAAID